MLHFCTSLISLFVKFFSGIAKKVNFSGAIETVHCLVSALAAAGAKCPEIGILSLEKRTLFGRGAGGQALQVLRELAKINNFAAFHSRGQRCHFAGDRF